jgi:gamma-glutamyltranspeptidase / glutathione hydrolase
MVSSSHPAISRAGIDVLASGGNAIDAALAMAAMSWLALPGQCGIGGDAFALVREPDGSVVSICGSGFGPDGGTPEFYAARGLRRLPRTGPLSVAAPGAVAALSALHAAGATRALDELWEPAVRAARAGLPCTARTGNDIATHLDELRADPDAAATLLRDGAAPQVGERIPQPRLAETIAHLARDPGDLYTGGLAERAVQELRRLGAPFSGEEWAAAGTARVEAALRGRYRGHRVHQTPPPSPGWMVLDQLAVCDGQLAGLEPLEPEAVHWLAGAARIAFADRVAAAGSDTDAWQRGSRPERVAEARRRIRENQLPPAVSGDPQGDTTSMVAVDTEGRAVSLIHSLAFTFGACITVPGSGVLLGNRLGRGAYLIPGHPNEVRPRRLPLHTLNAWIVTDDDGRLLHVGGTPGGDGQVQWNAQLISYLLDHGADAQQAVDAPRFSVFPGSDAGDLGARAELRCEDRFGAGTLDGLRALGHPVVVGGPWSGGGSAQVISLDHDRGCLVGGSDSRQEGAALGA